jgi:hypothetical protein
MRRAARWLTNESEVAPGGNNIIKEGDFGHDDSSMLECVGSKTSCSFVAENRAETKRRDVGKGQAELAAQLHKTSLREVGYILSKG